MPRGPAPGQRRAHPRLTRAPAHPHPPLSSALRAGGLPAETLENIPASQPRKESRPPPPPVGMGRRASTTQRQGQDDRPEGASACKVRSRCHLISEQVSLGYEMSLQFALAPLGGGFLKQRDRLGVGRGGQGQGEEREEGDRERETDGR